MYTLATFFSHSSPLHKLCHQQIVGGLTHVWGIARLTEDVQLEHYEEHRYDEDGAVYPLSGFIEYYGYGFKGPCWRRRIREPFNICCTLFERWMRL